MLQQFSKFPIRLKIILGFSCVLFAVAVVIILFSINDNRAFAIKSAKKEIKGMAKLVAETTGFGFDEFDFIYVRNAIKWLKQDPRIVSMKIYDNDSKLIAGFDDGMMTRIDPSQLSSIIEPYIKDHILFWAAPILGHDAALEKYNPKGKVLIGLSLASLNQELWTNQIQSISFAVAVFLFSILLTIALSNQITKPILHLAEVSNQVAEKGDYSLRSAKQHDDELGVLVDQFNEMLAQIQKHDRAMRDLNQELENRVQKRTRDLESAKEAAEDASHAKSEFLSCMSHELRTPMHAILGFGQLLRMNEDEPLTLSQQELISEILNAGKHLLELINEILDLAQIESGRLVISIDNVEVGAIVRENISLLLPMAQKKKVELADNIQTGACFYAKADPTRMKQIVLNLLSNAIKYNKERGSVTVSCHDEKEGFITLSVMDTGIGIDKEKQSDIFVPFDRLGAKNKSIEGTGIGLSITKKLIELMGGSIEFESALGEGSCFSITIPRGDEPSPSAALDDILRANSAPHLEKAKFKLLYVEDNAGSLSLVKHALGDRNDIQVLSAPQPHMGIEIASAHEPDLILWNVNLPGMDGISAIKLLKANEKTSRIPVFAVSDDAMEISAKKAMQAGFDFYLKKPLDIPRFLKELNGVFKK